MRIETTSRNVKLKDSMDRVLFTPFTQTPIRDFQPDGNHIRAMCFIRRHTMASSDTLYELMRNTLGLRNRHNFNEWIKRLYDGQMVFKPEAQQNTKNPDSHFHIYELTKKGIEHLGRHGLLAPVIRHSGPFRHQLMGATITGMKEIMCGRLGHTYMTGPELFARIGRPDQAKKVSIPFWWYGEKIQDERFVSFDPDMIDGIEYSDGRFAVHIDEYNCHTETLKPTKNFKCRSVLKTVMQMRQFIGEHQYRSDYGLNTMPIFCYYTTSHAHADNIVELVRENIGSCPYMTVGVEESFRTPFRPPRMPVHLFEGELKRAFKRPWIIGKLPEPKEKAA